MAEATHSCPIRGCKHKQPAHLLMCLTHWKMVSPQNRQDVHAHFKSGQTAMTASNEWHAAAKRAIKEVHDKLSAQKAAKGQEELALGEDKES